MTATMTGYESARAVAFWPHLPSADVASTRIRCLGVMDALASLGWQTRLYNPGDAPPPVLVLGKRYDADSLAHAQGLRRQHGTRLLLDLCDNHFEATRDDPALQRRATLLRAAVEAVDGVVASSATLARVVRDHCPGVRGLEVIDDLLDPLATGGQAGWHGAALAAFFALRRPAPGRRLVWFGQASSVLAEAGLRDLDRIAPQLAEHHARRPLTLTVLSNRFSVYRKAARHWRFPSVYLPWTAARFGALLARHDVALIPVTPNPFTVCKTSNRALTAFAAGLAVASDPMPAYDALADTIVVGDWDAGLARLMDGADERRRRVAAAGQLIQARHSSAAIGAQWARVLQQPVAVPA